MIRVLVSVLTVVVLFTCPGIGTAGGVTPAVVFAEVERIGKEVDLIKAHLGLTKTKSATTVHAPLLPRHVWQKSYEVQLKINLFRRQRGFPVIAANNLQPVLQLEPSLVYEQTQRLLTEVHLLKRRLGIDGTVPPPTVEPDKRPVDVFNKLNAISMQWDIINRQEINPADVYAEIKRVNEDVDTLLHHLRVRDNAFPPAKKVDATPSDSLATAYGLLEEVQRLQRLSGITGVDLRVFSRIDQPLPSDVLNMVSMVLAELQTVKAHLGLHNRLTPPTERHGDIQPAEVHQFLGYVTRKLRLIRSM